MGPPWRPPTEWANAVGRARRPGVERQILSEPGQRAGGQAEWVELTGMNPLGEALPSDAVQNFTKALWFGMKVKFTQT
jgi:hypothetical protein